MDPDAVDDGSPDHDPLVSALVRVRPDAVEGAGAAVEDPTAVVSEAAAMLGGGGPVPGGGEGGPAVPSDVAVPEQGSAMARAKGYFTRAGFEVHAPVGTSFSVAAGRSKFEEFFGVRLVVDEETLLSPVTTEDGGDELPLDAVPEDVRALLEGISLSRPPEIPGGLM